MRNNYKVFEQLPDGSSVWRACVLGQYEAERKIHELGEHSQNKFVAIDADSGDVLRVTTTNSKVRAANE